MANCTNWNVWYWPARYKPSGSSVGKAPESRSIKVHQGGSASKPTQVRFPVVTKKSLLPSKRQNGKWGYGNRCKNQLNTILCIFLHIMGLLYQTVTHLADKNRFSIPRIKQWRKNDESQSSVFLLLWENEGLSSSNSFYSQSQSNKKPLLSNDTFWFLSLIKKLATYQRYQLILLVCS